jgi:uncharacterized peroxidase-related enzyme
LRSLKNADGSAVNENLKAQLIADYRTADISDHDKLILEYAEKITLEPGSIDKDYIDSLKARGLNDPTALHDIVQVAAYFNYVNRLADGLGIELEG